MAAPRKPQDHRKPSAKKVSERQEEEANKKLARWIRSDGDPVTFTYAGREYEVERMGEWSVATVDAFENTNIATFVKLLYGPASDEWRTLSQVKMRELDDWFVALRDAVGVEPGESESSES